jgi:hypothetical protein
MDTSRISQGEMIAGIGGLALFISLFLNWFAGFSGWQTFDIVDVLLALLGVGVAVLVGARAAGNPIDVPGGASLVTIAGFAATCIVLTFLLEADERDLGMFIALAAAIAITYGGWTANRGAARTHSPAAARTDTTIP